MTEFTLIRHDDVSGVSGTGEVADGYEAPDGAVVLRWRGDRPSWGIWGDIRDVEAIHGHNGKSEVRYTDQSGLLAAYARVVPFLLHNSRQPLTCREHPDLPGRLRLTFRDEDAWRFWVALLDGSTDAAVHEEVNGEMQHRFTTPDGLIWLVYHSPLPSPTNDVHDDRDDR